jgi:3-deoxy-D-manno-octulosonic-acid transferase
VSVGEILAATALVKELKALLPQSGLIVSTGTETGQALARRHFAPGGAVVCYFPLDLPWAVSQALNILRPDIFVALESEVWPTFLNTAKGRGVSLALMNARLSDRSFRRYTRYRKYLFDFIDLFEVIAAGSQEDYRRLGSLGINGNKLVLTGNLKVDALLARRRALSPPSPPPLFGHESGVPAGPNQPGHKSYHKDRLNLGGEPVLLAASTHPGEEEVMLAAYEALKGPYPALLLILAPRHPDRADKVGDLLARRGLGFQRWKALKSGAEVRRQPVVLVDTVGDLFGLYGAADVAFVGGSLVPHGGQNILEPAVWGLTPLYGPHIENFHWAEDILKASGVGTVVQDAASLAAAARHLLDNPGERRRQGEAGLAAVSSHQGAARRQAELVAELIV